MARRPKIHMGECGECRRSLNLNDYYSPMSPKAGSRHWYATHAEWRGTVICSTCGAYTTFVQSYDEFRPTTDLR